MYDDEMPARAGVNFQEDYDPDVRESGIVVKLNRLDGLVNGCVENYHRLLKTLKPLSLNIPTDDGNKTMDPSRGDPASSLGAQIETISRKVDRLQVDLYRLRETLDL